jgi:hypothetical protein
MGYLDAYRARLSSEGATLKDVYENTTKDLINDSFADAPNYSRIPIGTDEYDVRIVSTDKPHEKKLLLRPDTEVDIGE